MVVDQESLRQEFSLRLVSSHNLTALRGIAAIILVVFHCDIFLKPVFNHANSMLIANGWVWVDFFFVLSGFLLTHIYWNDFEKSISSRFYFRFLIRRIAKIFPLHWFLLFITFGLARLLIWKSDQVSWYMAEMLNSEAIASHFLLTNSLNFQRIPTLNTPTWSLSAEWCTYVLYPFMACGFSRFMKLPTLVKVSIVTILLLFIFGIFDFRHIVAVICESDLEMHMTSDWGFLRCLVWFTLGLAARRNAPRFTKFKYLCSDLSFLVVLVLIFAGMHIDLNSSLIVLLFPLLIVSAVLNNGIVSAILSHPVFQYAGKLSFSIYMVHVPIIYVYWLNILNDYPDALYRVGAIQAAIRVPALQLCAEVLIASVTLSILLFRFIEAPSNYFIRNLFKDSR
ncbi:acyltransferase [Dyadobacter sp. CY261]|uniref:acyltransferase family protein n=1 Tax=Dyadobacter sp. CY261 TaxID=2907203 RepID=UPI001F33BF6B|nr:acyltransferase [Dyadobacter sp. CY261]MCF0075537.1 acyltransferase [Dyadobacter sp. CY261]